MIITRDYLKAHPEEIFVFGDNLLRQGKKGAAELRDESNSYGFITKRRPTNEDRAFYRSYEYESVFRYEINQLIFEIDKHPEKTYLISKLGAGLANRYGIFEKVIEPNIKTYLSRFKNVKFLW